MRVTVLLSVYSAQTEIEQSSSSRLPNGSMPEMHEVYLHFPLTNHDFDIRLLKIQAGNETDEIECIFVLASLDKKPHYEALSYAWGDSTSKVTVTLEGCKFPVTTNLENALRHLRRRDEDRVLWVDVVCINQRIQQNGIPKFPE